MKEKITLYHGASLDSATTILWYGPERNRTFYATTCFELAREAAFAHPQGKVAQIDLELSEFEKAINEGYFVQKPYLGMIQVEGAKEIEIKPGQGVEVIRRAIEAARPPY